MKKVSQVALGIVTGIGGFLEIGTTATSAEAGASFRFSLPKLGVDQCCGAGFLAADDIGTAPTGGDCFE